METNHLPTNIKVVRGTIDKNDKKQILLAFKTGEIYPQEIDIMRKINHPNIMPIYDFKFLDGQSSITMPLAAGDLTDLINNQRLSYKQKINIAHQLLSAVAFLHQQGVLHLDIKPENIFYFTDDQISVGDFGLSAYYDFPKGFYESTDERISEYYRAPELLTPSIKQYSTKSDSWSLGLTLLEFFSGDRSIYDENPTKDEIQNKFKDDKYIKKLLKSQDQDLINLISQLLSLDENTRISALNCLYSPLFKDLDDISPTNIILPSRDNKNSVDNLENKQKGFNYLLQQIKKYKKSPLSLLFLAVDLYYRSCEANDKANNYRLTALASIDLARNLIENDYLEGKNHDVDIEVARIVKLLKGLLYPEYIYYHISFNKQLLDKVKPIIYYYLNYHQFDLEQFLLENNIKQDLNSTLLIEDYL